MSDSDLSQVVSQGKGNMPAFGSTLSPEEVKAVISYVRTFKVTKK
jgi:mono/diheme cytochrome c family protein